MNKPTVRIIFTLLGLAVATSRVGADTTTTRPDSSGDNGRLLVCIASKCEYDNGKPADVEGPAGLAALAHKYGFPVTYYMKPFTVAACRAQLKAWHDQFGDEVGWLGDGTGLGAKPRELQRMRELADWQPITAAGDLRYGLDVSEFYRREGFQSVWGRCYEQSDTDGITDRGCPPGFYYALPACYRVPNQNDGGLISVPWLSNDLNLVFRTAQQSTFTFDPDDSADIHVSTPDDDSFWRAELDQYQKQTRYNKIVPLVVQQETVEFDFKTADPYNLRRRQRSAAILENLFKLLKQRQITVVSVSQAVQIYKQAYPTATPPSYNVFDNIGALPIIRKSPDFKMVTTRFSGEKHLAKFNGYFASNRAGHAFEYFSPDGKTFYERGKNLTYFDRNGLLVFDEGHPAPIRITPYLNDPAKYMRGILPELSSLFDTDKYIPKADVQTTGDEHHLRVTVKANVETLPDYVGSRLPYGVMLWGDYAGWELPDDAPPGTKILAHDGLIIPMVLQAGLNQVELHLRHL